MQSYPAVHTELPGPRSAAQFARQAERFYTQMHLGEMMPFILDRKDDYVLHDLDGNSFADHMSAWGSTPYGAFPPTVRAAVDAAMDRYGMEISCFLQSEPVLELADRLVALAPEGITRVAPTVTGTEAVEGAIKMAREATGRPFILSFLGQYHGESTHVVATASTEMPGESRGSAQFVPGFIFAPYPSTYRLPFRRPGEEVDDTLVVDYIENWLLAHQVEADQIAAVLVEPIAGELGVNAPSAGFWEGLERLRREHGWLLISDEVQSGLGRCGPVWAGDLWDLRPDLLLVGKAIAAGGQPLAAILGTDAVMADTHVYTTGTYAWEPGAVAGAIAGLDLLPAAMENALAMQDIARSVVGALPGDLKGVGEVRSYGSWFAIDFVTDQVTRTKDAESQRAFHQAAMRRGVFGISDPHKWVWRSQPALTMDLDLYRWSCERLVEAAHDVLG